MSSLLYGAIEQVLRESAVWTMSTNAVAALAILKGELTKATEYYKNMLNHDKQCQSLIDEAIRALPRQGHRAPVWG